MIESIAFVRKRYLERIRAEAAMLRRMCVGGETPCPLCGGRGKHEPDCICAKTIAEVKGGLR